MSDQGRSISLEFIFYLIVFVAGVFLRFYGLGWPPLSNIEALQALAAALPTPSASGFTPAALAASSPGYSNPTTLIFTLFGATDTNARVFPAVAGAALILVPIMLREKFGRSSSLLIAVMIAISPMLIATSRTAGGSSTAIFGIFAAIALLLAATSAELSVPRSTWAGAFLGLSISSGSPAIVGLAGLGLARLLAEVPRLRFSLELFPGFTNRSRVRLLLTAMVVAVAISAGLGFLIVSIPGLIEGLGNWLIGWAGPVRWPASSALLSLVVYDPFVLVFGLIGAAIALRERDPLGTSASLWALGALIFVLIYPSRSALDLSWVVLPLIVAAARGLVYLFSALSRSGKWWNWGLMAALLIVLASYAYLQLSRLANRPLFTETESTLALGGILGALALGAVVLVLFGVGWSWREAGAAGIVTLVVLLLGLSFSAGWRLFSGESADSAREILRPDASTSEILLLRQSIESISQAQLGRTDSITLQAIDPLSPAMAWALRQFEPFSPLEKDLGSSPPIVLARSGDAANNLRSVYIGQTFQIGETWGWAGGTPPSLMTWWVSRSAPTFPESWLLLVRSDLGSIETITEGSIDGEWPID